MASPSVQGFMNFVMTQPTYAVALVAVGYVLRYAQAKRKNQGPFGGGGGFP